MKDRIRRVRKAPTKGNDEFIAEMEDARREAVLDSRETIHHINALKRVLCEGEINYDELNRVMFGRPGWPRKGEP